MYKLLAIGLLILIVDCITPYAFASERNHKRYNDGYSGQQAITNFQHHSSFDTTCDPANRYSGGGGHTKIYCQGWKDGYTAEWNALVSTSHPIGPSSFNRTAPQKNSHPTTDWTAQFIVLIIIIIIIAIVASAWKFRHRSRKYRKRLGFSDNIKERTLAKQHHRCSSCNKLLNVVDFDHKDNNRSNNEASNCMALCPNCHAIKTRRSK